MHVVSHPAVPFWGHIPDGVHPGTVIHIDGHVPHHSERFDINLVTGQDVGHHASQHSSIALHFNPRVCEEHVVLNSRHHKSWGHEDTHRHNHSFHRGSSFSVTIHVESEFYRISVNGSHFCNFHHRMPYHEVGVLWIDGCVDIHRIEYRREHGATYVQTAYVPTNAYVTPTNTFVPATNTYVPAANVFVPGTYVDERDPHHPHHHHHHHH